VTQRERGRGGEIRIWAIEQNEARETYLNHYFGMDVADHMIKNTANKYIT
jgi:transcriptional regulator CtsR